MAVEHRPIMMYCHGVVVEKLHSATQTKTGLHFEILVALIAPAPSGKKNNLLVFLGLLP